MKAIKSKLRYYWIFLVSLLFYCIGIILHFVAQYGSNQPHSRREALEAVKPVASTIHTNSNMDNSTLIAENDNLKYTKPDNLFYFIQVSDIHISKKYTNGAQGHFYYFLKKMIPVIDPNFLFITGDMTDSQETFYVGTVEDDWKMYRKIIENTGIANKNNGAFLWDLRGNHDCFLVPEWTSSYNYYKDYSKTKTRGFAFNYETPSGSYSFTGLDGCPIYSATNPFFGFLDELSMDMYTKFMEESLSKNNHKHNFVFSHFPEITLKFGKSSSGKHWEDYTKNISLLLSGHLHVLGGSYIYGYHRKFLELVLTDFKIHGKYRIVAVDNDVVSVTDNLLPLPTLPYDFNTGNIDDLINNPPEIFNQAIPPVVHITSPKNSRFLLKKYEPVKEALDSGYIRVLVFSEQSPNDLKLSLFIDNNEIPVTFEYVGHKPLEKRSTPSINIFSRDEKNQSIINENHIIDFKTPPLWISKWDSSKYNDNKSHEMKIVAIDNRNLKGEQTIRFRFDGKGDDLGNHPISQFIVKSNLITYIPIVFIITFLIYELMILLPRLYTIRHIIPYHTDLPFFPNKYIGDLIANETKNFQNDFFKKHFILPWIEAFSIDGIFYPLQLLAISLLVLPIRFGIMSKPSDNISKYGAEFLYGHYSSGQWANTYDQYVLCTIFFILITFVDTLIIVFSNHTRKRHHFITYIILFFFFLFQVPTALFFSYFTGGIIALILSPFPTWNCLYCWFLIIMIIVRRIKDHRHQKSKLNI